MTIAQIEGRVRGVRSEFVLATDMRFAARETAIVGQVEPAFGLLPGGGAAQHLVRLMGRGRALEVMLSAEDYDAELAERSRGSRPQATPWSRIGSTRSHSAPAEDFRRDSDRFGDGVRVPDAQARIQNAIKRGFQTRDAEMTIAHVLLGAEDRSSRPPD